MARVESLWTAEQSFTTEEYVEPPPGAGETILSDLYYHEDFSQGSNGSGVESTTAFNNATKGYVDTSFAHPNGNGRSMRSEYKTSYGDGWDEWGFVWEGSKNGRPGPLKMHRYGEAWFRVVAYYPSNWNWLGGQPDVKGFRFYYTKEGGNQNDTSLGFQSAESSPSERGDLRTRFTNYNPDDPGEKWRGSAPTLGSWTVMEAYQRLDYIAEASGGKSTIRFWRNGVPFGKQTGHVVSDYTAAKMVRFMMHTYVNKGFPQDQNCWFDSATWAYRGNHDGGYIDNTGSMDTDNTGFPFIGVKIKD